MNAHRTLRILLVEDDESLVLFFCRALHRAGHQIEICLRGDAGLHAAIAGDYDLLMVDWDLPGLNGAGVVRGAREAGVSHPVLVLTGHGDAKRAEALAAGCNAFLEKPCGMGELLAAVESFSGESVAHAA